MPAAFPRSALATVALGSALALAATLFAAGARPDDRPPGAGGSRSTATLVLVTNLGVGIVELRGAPPPP